MVNSFSFMTAALMIRFRPKSYNNHWANLNNFYSIGFALLSSQTLRRPIVDKSIKWWLIKKLKFSMARDFVWGLYTNTRAVYQKTSYRLQTYLSELRREFDWSGCSFGPSASWLTSTKIMSESLWRVLLKL